MGNKGRGEKTKMNKGRREGQGERANNNKEFSYVFVWCLFRSLIGPKSGQNPKKKKHPNLQPHKQRSELRGREKERVEGKRKRESRERERENLEREMLKLSLFFFFLSFFFVSVSALDWSPRVLSPRGNEMKENKEIVLIRVLVECKPSLCLGRRRDWREAFAEGMRGMTQLDVFTYDSVCLFYFFMKSFFVSFFFVLINQLLVL